MESDLRATARLRRRFRAPSECVFDAWLDPAMLDRWMFGTALARGESVRLMVDPREGGRYEFVSGEVQRVGTYLEIDRPSRLVFTWAPEAESPGCDRVTIETWPTDSGCELLLSHELPESRAGRATDAWSELLDALGRAVRAHAVPPIRPPEDILKLMRQAAGARKTAPEVPPRHGLRAVLAAAWAAAALALWKAWS